MNLMKIVCGGLGAVMLPAGSILAFSEPTPPPVTTAAIPGCSAGKCGSPTSCESAAVASCQETACPAARAKACCDKTIPVAVTGSECPGDACPAGEKSCCESKGGADKTIPVAVTESCCKAENACVTKSSCKSSKCDGQADGCDGECCESGTCKSACCDEKVSADVYSETGKCCDKKTVPVAVNESECKDGACKADGCQDKVSAEARPAEKKECCDKTAPVSATKSECKEGTCPVSKKTCCESECSAKDKECDGECCKAGTCEAACCDEKVSADACPAAKKDCCDKSVPVAVKDSACQGGACPTKQAISEGTHTITITSEGTGENPPRVTLIVDKNTNEESRVTNGEITLTCRPNTKCAEKPVAVTTESKCESAGCPVSAKSCCKSECSAGDKSCDGECCKAGTCEAACCDEKVSADACSATGKCCDKKTVPVAVKDSECQGDACPVSAKASCESGCGSKGNCATTKVAACSTCGQNGCTTEKCAGIDACESACQGTEKCSASEGCEAACPTSRKSGAAETPAEGDEQASRSIRLRFGFGGERDLVARSVKVRLFPASTPKPFVSRANHCGVVNGTRKIAAALVSASVKVVVPMVAERTASTTEQAPPPQPPEPPHFVHTHGFVAPQPLAGCETRPNAFETNVFEMGPDCPHAYPLDGRHHDEFADAELRPPCAHFTNTAFSCPLCARGHAAMHPPVFHPHHPGFVGPPPGFVRFHFDAPPMPPSPVAGPIMEPIPPGLPHHGFLPSWTHPPVPVVEPLIPPSGPLAWHHPRMMDREPASRCPAQWSWTTMAVGADEERSLVRTHVQRHMESLMPRDLARTIHAPREYGGPVPPPIAVRTVSFEGDAPAPGVHPAHRSSRPHRASSPIEGSWVQQAGDTTINVTCEPSRIQGTARIAADGSDEQTTIQFSGTCSVAPDGQLFGVIDHLSMSVPGESPRDVQTFESKMVDQPFAIRFRTDGELLFIKDVKCAGVESLGVVDKRGDADSFLNVFACGKYTRDRD